jgi:hypothetical protein
MQDKNSSSSALRRNLLISGVAAAVCLTLVGCGQRSSSGRNNISGKVTFAGNPIPVGRIYFDPDASMKNDGLQGYAEIKDGYYDTAKTDKGPTGGPVIVRIEAFDGVALDAERPNGKPLFPSYQKKVELPRGQTTMDFDVPALASRMQPSTGGYIGP